MKTIVICGNPWANIKAIESLLLSGRMQPAKAAKRDETESIQTWHERIFNAYFDDADVDSISPSRPWEQMATEIFAANADQDCWGWADSKSTWLLDFWLNYDPHFKFVLVYSSPDKDFAKYINNENSEHNTEVFIQTWLTYNKELLKFYNRHSDRSVLVNCESCIDSPEIFRTLTSEKFSFSFSEMDSQQINSDETRPLLEFLTSQMIASYQETKELFAEMEATAEIKSLSVKSSIQNKFLSDAINEYQYICKNAQQLSEAKVQLRKITDALEENLANSQSTKIELEKRIASLNLEHEQSLKTQQQLRTQVEQLNESSSQIKIELEKKIVSLSFEYEQLNECSSQIKVEMEKKIVSLNTECELSRKNQQQLQKQVEKQSKEKEQTRATLQAQIAQLNQSNSQAKTELEKKIAFLNAESEQLRKNQEQLLEELSAAHLQIKDKEQYGVALQTQIEQLKQSSSQTKVELEKKIAVINSENKDLYKKQQYLQKQLEDVQKQNQADQNQAQQERELLLLQLHQTQEELEQLFINSQSNKTELEKRITELNVEQEQSRKKQQQLQNQLGDAQKQNQIVQNQAQQESELLILQLHQVQEELEQLFINSQSNKTELEKRITELNVEQEQSRKKQQQLQNQLGDAQKQNQIVQNQAQQESELLILQLHQVQEELEQLFINSQAELAAAQSQIKDKEQAGTELQKQVETLTKSNNQVKTELEKKIATLNAEDEKSGKKQEQLQKELAAAQSQIKEKEQARTELQKQVETLTKSNNQVKIELEKKIAALSAEDEKSRKAQKQLQKQVESLIQSNNQVKTESEKRIAALNSESEQSRKNQQQLQEQLDKDQKQNQVVQKELQQENELLILQLHQVQEELEHYFVEYQILKSQNQNIELKWKKLSLRHPDLYDYSAIDVTDIEIKPDYHAINWKIQDFLYGDENIKKLNFKTIVDGDRMGFLFEITDENDNTEILLSRSLMNAGNGDDFFIPLLSKSNESVLAPSEVSNLAATDWVMIKVLFKLVITALEQQNILSSETRLKIDVEYWLKTIISLRQAYLEIPKVFRFDKVYLYKEKVNPDYEHLWFKFNDVRFGDSYWPEFQFRLAAAEVNARNFSVYPKLEFPLSEDKTLPFEKWYVQIQDSVGERMELRFALTPPAIDIQTWNSFAGYDKELIASILRQLPFILNVLEKQETRISRSYEDWNKLANDMQNVFKLLITDVQHY